MTSDEHLKWAKERAMEYLPGDPANVLASFFSDMRKHVELVSHSGLELGSMLMVAGKLNSSWEVGDHIMGYN